MQVGKRCKNEHTSRTYKILSKKKNDNKISIFICKWITRHVQKTKSRVEGESVKRICAFEKNTKKKRINLV